MKKLLLLMICSCFSLPGFAQCFNGWSYSEPITITNNNAASTDFQVEITLNTAALVALNKMQASGNDIRFVEGLTCCTALPHYVQSGMNTATTKIWVKVPSLPANGTKTIYVLYGNNTAANAADPENTFDLWEDYNTAPYDLTLACGTGTATASGGSMTYSWPSFAQWSSNTTFPVGTVYTAEANVTSVSGNWPGLYWAQITSQKSYALLYGGGQVRISVHGSGTNMCDGHNWANTPVAAGNNPGIWQYTWVATGDHRATFPVVGNMTSNNTLYARNQDMKINLGGISGGTGSFTVDWVRARKFAQNTPTAVIGAESAFAATTIAYTGTFCAGSGTATPTLTGISGGTYSAPVGVTINSTTGVINLASSTGGTYTISYDSPATICPLTVTTTITITQPTGTIAVSGSNPICEGQSSTISFTGAPGSTLTYTTNGTDPQTILMNGGGSNSFSTPVLNSNTLYTLTNAAIGACNAPLNLSTTVTVNPAPAVTITNNGAATICDGSSTGISLNFTGTQPYSFTYFDGVAMQNVTNHNNNTFGFSVSPNTSTTYYVTSITDGNLCGATPSGMSDIADVTVEYAPAITTQPVSFTECTGGDAAITVVASGTNPVHQWYNGVTQLTNTAPYSGADAATLNISDITGMNTNTFYVTVSNNCGSVNSNTVTLTEDLDNTWSGAVNSAWSNIGNWSCGIVPVATTNVFIPASAPNMPEVDIPGAICNDITIAATSDITFIGANNQLEVRGNITNNGDFDGTGGKVLLNGTTQTIMGNNITFGGLEVAGGSAKTLMNSVTVAGVLNMNNGNIILNGLDLNLDMPWANMGGSAASFIVTNGTGSVIGRNMGTGGNPDPALFPIGINSSSYTPITIENTGIADTFTVRVIEHVYEDGYGVAPAQVPNAVVDRTWMIHENTPGGSFATVTPQWNGIDAINGFDNTHVFVAHYMNSEWTSEIESAASAPAATGSDPYTTMEDSITSFSPFTVASVEQFPLAIRLNSINAVNVGSRNKVSWKSSTEEAGEKFQLERSVDGRSFTTITTVPAKGQASEYTYWDEKPFSGTNYYRLKMLTAQEMPSYSKVVSATVTDNGNLSIDAYPNPITNKVTVTINGTITGKGYVTIKDVTGKTVRTATEVVNNRVEFNLNNLAQGMYMINYSDETHNESVKITKQ